MSEPKAVRLQRTPRSLDPPWPHEQIEKEIFSHRDLNTDFLFCDLTSMCFDYPRRAYGRNKQPRGLGVLAPFHQQPPVCE